MGFINLLRPEEGLEFAEVKRHKTDSKLVVVLVYHLSGSGVVH